MKFNIVDNFLPQKDFDEIKNLITGPSFPWYYNSSIAFHESQKENDYYFTHIFYENDSRSNFFNLINNKILCKIKFFTIKRIKANFYPRTEKLSFHKKHVDYNVPHKAMVFCINTCDGFTVVEKNTKIQSIENRALFFDPSKKHNSTTCTNTKGRFNINFNYI